MEGLRKITRKFYQELVQVFSHEMKAMYEAVSLTRQAQDIQRALAHVAYQPDFLFRDLSWHFTNTTDAFPFCR